MKVSWALLLALLISLSLTTQNTAAAVIRFDTLITGQTSYGFDGDGDGINDVIFSTTDPSGFNTIGPGLNQNYIQEPGLEGTALLNPDLRVDFLKGAVNSVQFGFALDSSVANSSYFASLQLYNSSNALIGSISVPGAYTSTSLGTSSFPEGVATLNFNGIASYGLFNFTSEFGRYIIDNVQGTFGSTEDVTPSPEPGAVFLVGFGLTSLLGIHRRYFK
jgi:hypothetical protein